MRHPPEGNTQNPTSRCGLVFGDWPNDHLRSWPKGLTLRTRITAVVVVAALAISCGEDSPGPTAPTPTPPPTQTPTPPPPTETTVTLTDLSMTGPAAFVDNLVVTIGESVQLDLDAEYSDGTTQRVTTDATWVSSNEHVATVSAGRITGRNRGGVQVRATFEGMTVRTPSFRVEPRPEPWSATGSGATILPLPTNITRIRIEGEYRGRSVNFVVWCGPPENRGGLLVNEILGTGGIASGTRYSGIHSARRQYGGSGPCRELSIEKSSGVKWTITQVDANYVTESASPGMTAEVSDQGNRR